ncbi:hypothetical protein D3C79_560140 [compost metagenome]
MGEDPLAVDTTDVVAVQPAALAGSGYRHTRLVAHQILDIVHVLPVQLLTGLHADSARHLADVLCAAGGADGHLLQGDHVACGLALQYHIAVADLAKTQPGTPQQALEGSIWRQRTLYAWRSHAVGQLGAEADLPAGDLAESIDGRNQRLLADAEAVVAHARAAGLGRLGGQRRQAAGAAGEQGKGQQGQLSCTAGKVGRAGRTSGHRKRSQTRGLL